MSASRLSERFRPFSVMAAALAVVVVIAGCSSSSKKATSNTTAGGGSSSTEAGNKASAPGVKSSSINVALITSLTGSDSSNSITIPKGFRARIDAQNAAGGVNGRQITFVIEDDQSSVSQAQTAAQA